MVAEGAVATAPHLPTRTGGLSSSLRDHRYTVEVKSGEQLICFGRHAAEQRASLGEGKPETFDFLGFSVLQRHIERRQHGMKMCRTAT